MIGLSQAIFSFSISSLLDFDRKFAVFGSLIPTFSLVLIYSGPLQYEGVLLSFTSGLFFSSLIYLGFSAFEAKSTFLGYCCTLLLESLSFSYLPLFYPFYGFHGLGLFSSFDPIWNLAIISVSIGILAYARYREA